MDHTTPNGNPSDDGNHSPFSIHVYTADQVADQHNNNQDMLTLTLSCIPQPSQPPLPAPELSWSQASAIAIPSRSRQPLSRRKNSRNAGIDKSPTIPAPYPWATDRRATVHRLSDLIGMQITAIGGTVQCKRCEREYEMELDLVQKFEEIKAFVIPNKEGMRHRAPKQWQCPKLLRCGYCNQENSVKPVISSKKRNINWLFLFLGQMLGCCTLEQLKYFCKHTKNHRTGAKNRVLFLAYLGICKQLDPEGPFDV